ncbi:regulatory protein RecX [Ichthyenterobacterium sp. W332]|uniref:Regulatory protein RecX n=1 Tax=Microcosmobacter mediterraneus TaxID=3075607 RepID=A0ABU2YI86_9FLAO|nr:regulatory protein RecX [Ichthyenterobacterium sp. W332]MDT0557889.1 regulatory protein RecX [Ichthyenterobacterium sp. W332]
MKDSYTVSEALQLAQNYCAYQERCHKDVEQKLKSINMIPEVILHIISQLIEGNYLNEERFAKSFARGKFSIKKWGKHKIVRELKLRDISKYNIKSALKEIDEENYFKTLDELAKKRLLQLKEKNIYKRKRKLCDYLLYRGWEPYLVYEKASELIK